MRRGNGSSFLIYTHVALLSTNMFFLLPGPALFTTSDALGVVEDRWACAMTYVGC